MGMSQVRFQIQVTLADEVREPDKGRDGEDGTEVKMKTREEATKYGLSFQTLIWKPVS